MSSRPQLETHSAGEHSSDERSSQRPFFQKFTDFFNDLYLRSGAARYGLSEEQWVNILAQVLEKYPEPCPDGTRVRDFVSKLHLEDLALSRGCAAGSEVAWEVLLTRYREQMYEAASAIARDDGRGKEIADSLYAELYGIDARGEIRASKLQSYTGIGSLGGWLRSVLAQSYIDRYRFERRFVKVEDQELESGLKDVTTAVESRNVPVDPRLEQATKLALAAISEEDRFILVCHFIDGRNLAQIGQTLNLNRSTLSRRIEKATASIRKNIKKALFRSGMSPAQVEEALGADVRDVNVDVKKQLLKNTQQTRPQPFHRKR